MSSVIHFKKQSLDFQSFGGDENLGKSSLARLVDDQLSGTLGAGILHLDGCSITWTVLYDEVCVVLEGHFKLGVGDDTIVAGPGDTVWIPKNTTVIYQGESARVFYALYPVDWKRRQ